MALSNLRATLLCFMCTESEDVNYTNEKNALLSYQDSRNAAHIADDVMDIIRSTSLSGPALEMQLDSIVGMYGWTENVAKWVLEKLCHLLEQEERKLGPTVHEAYHRAWEVAKSIEGFVIEHPVFCTIIALGVLVGCPS